MQPHFEILRQSVQTYKRASPHRVFTCEHFYQETAEELFRVKDLEKRLKHYNLMAE